MGGKLSVSIPTVEIAQYLVIQNLLWLHNGLSASSVPTGEMMPAGMRQSDGLSRALPPVSIDIRKEHLRRSMVHVNVVKVHANALPLSRKAGRIYVKICIPCAIREV